MDPSRELDPIRTPRPSVAISPAFATPSAANDRLVRGASSGGEEW